LKTEGKSTVTLFQSLKLEGPLTHSIGGSVADHLADLVFFVGGFDCFVERFPVFVLLEFCWAERFPIRWRLSGERPFVLHLLTEDVKRDEGMGFDPDVEEFSITARSCKVGDDKSLGAALVALHECEARRGDVNIESFLVWILQVSSVVAEELTAREAKASSPGDLK
jgi:hypothetical protein